MKYSVEGDPKVYITKIEQDKTVAGFLELVRERANRNLCAVWKGGARLPLEDQMSSWCEWSSVFCVAGEGFDPPPSSPRTTYLIYTNLTRHSLQKGDAIDLDDTWTVDQVRKKIEGYLTELATFENAFVPNPHDIYVFLPGGLPFLSGTLGDWCSARETSCRIYVVVTRPLGASVSRVISELTDCSNAEMQRLLSPIHDSTAQGYAAMACFLGYIQHGGPQIQRLFLHLTNVTRFAPLVSSLYRIIEQEEITGLDVVSITGVLHTLFKHIGDPALPDHKVLDNTLMLASTLLLINQGEMWRFSVLDWNDETAEGGIEGYCRTTGQQRHCVVCCEGEDGYNIIPPTPEERDSIFDNARGLKPVSPLTTRYLHSTAIMKGRTNVMLMLGHVPGNQNEIRYIDPAAGKAFTRSIEDLCREIGDDETDDVIGIEGERIEQTLEILFDSSNSMKAHLSDYMSTASEETKIEYAKRLLSTIISRLHASRVASIFGLGTFNERFEKRCRLSSQLTDYEGVIDDIKPAGKSYLWDAIMAAINTIHDDACFSFYDDYDDDVPAPKCPNATQRILVISDGRDDGSKTHPWEAASHCIQNKIIVDSVIIAKDENNEDLALLCDVTGGSAFWVASVEQGLELCEQEAFLNIACRRPGQVSTRRLTEAVWRELRSSKRITGAESPTNLFLYQACQGHDISSLEHIVKVAEKQWSPKTLSSIRIVSEARYILNHPNDNLQVWIKSDLWECWRVFLKGPEGTPYSGKWWSLYVTFPRQYPAYPPTIRFLSIPYHPNISKEGLVVFSKVDDEYDSSLRVLDILASLIELLRTPELGEPIQARIAEVYRNRDEFDRTARRVTDEQAKNSIDDYPYMQGVAQTCVSTISAKPK